MLGLNAGGQGGIRTHGELAPTAVFKTAALNHSATCPPTSPYGAGKTRLARRRKSCKLVRQHMMQLGEAMRPQDIAEVVNLINLYPVAVDTQTWALFDQVFTEDASTDFGGGAVFAGLESIKTVFEAIHAPFDATQHVTTNHQVSVAGDSATCLSYVHARFIRMAVAGGTMFESTGWYDDALVRTPAGWRIRKRNCRTIWSGGNPAVLQTTPDVHVEEVLKSLRNEARAGRLGHVAGLTGQIG